MYIPLRKNSLNIQLLFREHIIKQEWNGTYLTLLLNSVGARLRVKQGYHIRMKTRSVTGRERLIERETAERATHKYYEKSIQIQE